ncbi:MAG: DUF4432 family protein [Planctomycetes bacterium]|nr:DUF4432 family protein [Planctomycetota bacterium]
MSDGVQVIEVDTGRMRLSILPTRGMGIWRAELPDGERLGWKSPVHGPVHPKFVPLTDPSGLGWLDGFDELVVRCGLESNGGPAFDEENGRLVYPLHGRIANRPAHHVSRRLRRHDHRARHRRRNSVSFPKTAAHHVDHAAGWLNRFFDRRRNQKCRRHAGQDADALPHQFWRADAGRRGAARGAGAQSRAARCRSNGTRRLVGPIWPARCRLAGAMFFLRFALR